MTDFAWRGHGVSVAAGIWALTKLDTEDAFKIAMAWVAGIAIACPYNAKFDIFGTYKEKYPMSYVPQILMPALLAAGFIANPGRVDTSREPRECAYHDPRLPAPNAGQV